MSTCVVQTPQQVQWVEETHYTNIYVECHYDLSLLYYSYEKKEIFDRHFPTFKIIKEESQIMYKSLEVLKGSISLLD